MYAAGFLSYVRFHDAIDRRQIIELRRHLENEVGNLLGSPFELYDDADGAAWSQHWQRRFEQGLMDRTLFIPVITPAYLSRQARREEFLRCLQAENDLKRDDLIQPIIYAGVAALHDPAQCSADPVLEALASRRQHDWRDLHHAPWNAEKLNRLSALASDLAKALKRTLLAPPIIVTVDPTPGQGDYTSIGEALSSIKGGERILIRPHLYREVLVMDKPADLVGDGDSEEIIIEASEGSVLQFLGPYGRVANLTLRQLEGAECFGVEISGGQLVMEDCEITSASYACVAIVDGADPILRRNRIHGGKQGGVLVQSDGKGTLEDNDIYDNSLAGVEIRDGGDPLLRRNRIHDGKQGGILVQSGGKGTIEENDIFANALAGVEIRKGGDPLLQRNRIHDGLQGGILVQSDGKGTIKDNDIYGNNLAGVEIREAGNPLLRRNRIGEGKASGVYVHKNGLGTLEDNDIFANARAGVEIGDGANPVVRRNIIRDGQQGGVLVQTHARGTLKQNDIHGNNFSGLEIRNGGDPLVQHNSIRDGKQGGVLIHTEGKGTLEQNDIAGNTRAGVEIGSASTPVFRANVIRENGYQGIWVHDGGGGTFENNDLRGNSKGPWLVEAASAGRTVKINNVEK